MNSCISTLNTPRHMSSFWHESPHWKQCCHSKCKELLVASCVRCERKKKRHVLDARLGVYTRVCVGVKLALAFPTQHREAKAPNPSGFFSHRASCRISSPHPVEPRSGPCKRTPRSACRGGSRILVRGPQQSFDTSWVPDLSPKFASNIGFSLILEPKICLK